MLAGDAIGECGIVEQETTMGEPAARGRASYEDYLALERATDRKHEWLDGQVFAMAGGTPEHSALSAAMIAELRRLAGRGPCVVHTSDLKLRVPRTKLATYADAVVVCGEPVRDSGDPNAITNPTIIVEVLSDSSERWDRGGKFRNYRAIESLRDYIIVSQHERSIEVYSRNAQGRWMLYEASGGETVRVSALDGVLEVDEVYRGITLPAADRGDGG
jgi:Uma2 family endonuclease